MYLNNQRKPHKWKIIVLLIVVSLFLTACTQGENGQGEVSLPTETENTYHSQTPMEEEVAEDPGSFVEIIIDEHDIVDIGDRFFATQVNDIILNSFDRYLGRPIRYEGLFWAAYWEWSDRYYYHVIRHTYGCCGPYETSVGFELYLGDIPAPPDDTWVKVLGILERSGGEGISHVRLRVVSLTPVEAGLAFVSN